jgi:hypothetical protein
MLLKQTDISEADSVSIVRALMLLISRSYICTGLELVVGCEPTVFVGAAQRCCAYPYFPLGYGGN